MNRQRYLVVVSGPSGIGKDTVVRRLMKKHPEIELSVSATTRPPRSYEVSGQHYYFLTLDAFKQCIEEGKLVEYANYAGNFYGTPRCEVERRIDNSTTCILVIEVNGAEKVKQVYPDCTTVFIIAPSMAEHERRLRQRATEDEAGMRQRMQIAQQEMAMADKYDFQLVNDDPDVCADELYEIICKRQEA
ncbi:MAG: guanylate kinase [Oscillospiraceae bacterium]